MLLIEKENSMDSNKIIDNDIRQICLCPLPWNELLGKTVLVTGASGLIGGYVTKTLLYLNYLKNFSSPVRIIALGRHKSKMEAKFADYLKDPNLLFCIGDVSKLPPLDGTIDYIIHCASQASPKFYGIDPVGTLKANSVGTINLLDLAVKSKTKKFLFISSGEIYGKAETTNGTINESNNGNVKPDDIRSCYAESKRLGETACVCYSHQFGLNVNFIRPSHTYGPGIDLNDGRVFADFCKCIVNNENIILNSDGSARRSFLYITDFIRGLFTVLFKGKNCEAYNTSSDKTVSILELANLLCTLFPDKNLKVKFNKKNLEGYIPSKVQNIFLSNFKLKSLGWKPNVDESEGFKRMINSYLD